MKILAVSDVIEQRLYHPGVKDNYPSLDLILGCGDLPYDYLEFLVSMFNVPLLYVPGNHDPKYDLSTPGSGATGCINVDRRLVTVRGLTISGLGGSILYKPSAVNQYTQFQMWTRLVRLSPALFWSWARRRKPLDIMIAHSPPLGINDEEDHAHTGFRAFLGLIKIFKPRYFLHGHTMAYRTNIDVPQQLVAGTQVINIHPFRLLEVETDG